MAATVAAVQESFTFSHLTGVFAASGDKDVAGMLAELEPLLTDIVVTRTAQSSRFVENSCGLLFVHPRPSLPSPGGTGLVYEIPGQGL